MHVILPPDDLRKHYSAVVYDENDPSPEVFIGQGETGEDALRDAEGKYEKKS